MYDNEPDRQPEASIWQAFWLVFCYTLLIGLAVVCVLDVLSHQLFGTAFDWLRGLSVAVAVSTFVAGVDMYPRVFVRWLNGTWQPTSSGRNPNSPL